MEIEHQRLEQKAFVLLSGGVDSSTCLAQAVINVGRKNVYAISIDYGQRHKAKELNCAKRQADTYHIENHIIWDASQVMPQTGMLTDATQDIPDIAYSEIEGISPTYVPFRNGFLLSTLAAIAMSEIGDDTPTPGEEHMLFYGAHAEDSANWAYPDCTPEFIGAMANAIFIGTYQRCRLHTPLQWLAKHEVVTLGTQLGVEYKNTWSCYKGDDLHCGVCPTCRARKEAFELANIADPTEYAA